MKRTARTAKQLGTLIRRERKSRGLTQAELGAQVSLRQATISKLEAGEPATEIRTLLDVLTALHLEIRLEDREQGAPDDIENLF